MGMQVPGPFTSSYISAAKSMSPPELLLIQIKQHRTFKMER